ncbi:hypothetical protein T4B_1618 [Trichinella pseudospiralis]|uniref:Uncharacterized protein n=1 Tax=Trichinella pseudospiralis TaxID=6337 RepID=A0A0V1IVI0_TRIPS|nr:hypothetical protein T4B_2074 [Trichinella pseudospiralis]KRZ26804.1 hypothetical protein T4B_1618 [Trichinella pseudospiralis]
MRRPPDGVDKAQTSGRLGQTFSNSIAKKANTKNCSQTSVGGCRSVKGKRDAPAELDEEDIPGQTTLYGGGGAEI